MLLGLARDWRQPDEVHGEEPAGSDEYARLRDAVGEQSRVLGRGLSMGGNRVAAHSVLESRILSACLDDQSRARERAP